MSEKRSENCGCDNNGNATKNRYENECYCQTECDCVQETYAETEKRGKTEKCICADKDENACCGQKDNHETDECDCVGNSGCSRINDEDLREIYKNACLGKISIEILEKFCVEKSFKNLLIKQYKEYTEAVKEIELYANKVNINLQKPSVFARSMMYMTTAVNTMSDKSDSKLSEIMLQGINMGIISLTKLQNKLKEEGKSCACCDNLLKLLNKNLSEMKMYL